MGKCSPPIPYAPDDYKALAITLKGSSIMTCRTHNLHFLNALDLALDEHFDNVIIESDAKYCIDALACPLEESCWKIRTLTTLPLELAIKFSFVSFELG